MSMRCHAYMHICFINATCFTIDTIISPIISPIISLSHRSVSVSVGEGPSYRAAPVPCTSLLLCILASSVCPFVCRLRAVAACCMPER